MKTDLPLSGVVAVSGAFDGYVETATFDLSGGAGALEIARILPEPFLLESFRLRGTIEDDGARINIAEATLDLPKGQVIMNASATRVGAGLERAIRCTGVVIFRLTTFGNTGH